MKKYKVGNKCIVEVRSFVRKGRNLVAKSTNVEGIINKVFQRYRTVIYYVDTDNGGIVCRPHHEIYLIPIFTKIKIL